MTKNPSSRASPGQHQVGAPLGESAAHEAAASHGILCTSLRFSYGPRRVLGSLDLSVAPGECLVLVGRNGAGKTTLVRILATLARRQARVQESTHYLEGLLQEREGEEAAGELTDRRGQKEHFMRQQACHVPAEGPLPSPVGDSPARRVLPFLLGGLGAGFLVLLYLGIVTWAQGWAHAVELLSQDRAFVAAIAAGFGLQVGLYGHLRLVVHHRVRLAMPTAATGVGTGTSSAAMVACCLHHVTDVLPLLGLSGAAIFLNDYRVPFMVGGLVVNGIGVAIMLRVVLRGRAHLRALGMTARTEAQQP